MLINTHLHRSILKIVETIKAFLFYKEFLFYNRLLIYHTRFYIERFKNESLAKISWVLNLGKK